MHKSNSFWSLISAAAIGLSGYVLPAAAQQAVDEALTPMQAKEMLPPDLNECAAAKKVQEEAQTSMPVQSQMNGMNNGAMGNGMNNGAMGNGMNNGAMGNGMNNGAMGNGMNNGAMGNGMNNSAMGNGMGRATNPNDMSVGINLTPMDGDYGGGGYGNAGGGYGGEIGSVLGGLNSIGINPTQAVGAAAAAGTLLYLMNGGGDGLKGTMRGFGWDNTRRMRGPGVHYH